MASSFGPAPSKPSPVSSKPTRPEITRHFAQRKVDATEAGSQPHQLIERRPRCSTAYAASWWPSSAPSARPATLGRANVRPTDSSLWLGRLPRASERLQLDATTEDRRLCYDDESRPLVDVIGGCAVAIRRRFPIFNRAHSIMVQSEVSRVTPQPTLAAATVSERVRASMPAAVEDDSLEG